ncbi:MAG: hypothetical protein ACTSRP_23700 [Candidatus Helarchaeota archaeon]
MGNVNFGVRRNKKEWELTLYLYYSIREFPEVVREIINDSRLIAVDFKNTRREYFI